METTKISPRCYWSKETRGGQVRLWVAHWGCAAPVRAPEESAGTSMGRARKWDHSARAELQNWEWEWNFREFKSLLYLVRERGCEGSGASVVPGAGAASSKICSQYLRKTFAVISSVIKGLTFSHGIWCPHCTLVRKLFVSFQTQAWAAQGNGYLQQLNNGVTCWATPEQGRQPWLVWWGSCW